MLVSHYDVDEVNCQSFFNQFYISLALEHQFSINEMKT